MAEVNTSLYGGLAPQVYGGAGGGGGAGLAGIGQTVGGIDQLLQLQSKMAIGHLMQTPGVINPETGDFDLKVLAREAAKTPATARLLPELTGQIIQRQNMQAETAKKTIETAGLQYDLEGKLATSLLSRGRQQMKDPMTGQPVPGQFTWNGDNEDMLRAFSDPAFVKAFGPEGAAKMLAQYTDPRMSPTQRYSFIAQRALQGQTGAEALNRVVGTMSNMDQGGYVQPTAQSPFMGTSTPIGPKLQKTGTPEMMSHLQPTVDSRGVPSVSPAGDLGLVRPGQMPGEAAPQPQQVAPAASIAPQIAPASAVPGAAAPPGASGATPTPGATEPPPTGVAPSVVKVPTGLGTIEKKQLDEFPAYVKETNEAGHNALELQQVINEMDSARKNFSTGGGADALRHAAVIAQALGVSKEKVDALAGGNLGSVQEYDKLAAQLATSILKQQVQGTGRAFQIEYKNFLEKNPNLDTDPRAITRVFNYMRTINDRAVTKSKLLNDNVQLWNNNQPLHLGMKSITEFEPTWQNYISKHVVPTGEPRDAGPR